MFCKECFIGKLCKCDEAVGVVVVLSCGKSYVLGFLGSFY